MLYIIYIYIHKNVCIYITSIYSTCIICSILKICIEYSTNLFQYQKT